jgi:hypothetical protein
MEKCVACCLSFCAHHYLYPSSFASGGTQSANLLGGLAGGCSLVTDLTKTESLSTFEDAILMGASDCDQQSIANTTLSKTKACQTFVLYETPEHMRGSTLACCTT